MYETFSIDDISLPFQMASKKDYHLSNTEKSILVQNIPPSQKRIHISFHADIHIGKKKHSNVIIGLTEHYILPIVKGFFSGFKVPQLYHIIDINEIDVTKENEVNIIFYNKLPPIKIQSLAVIHFVRSLIRNYVLGLPLLPPHKRFIFHSYDMSKFPLFKPRLSPSQLFQLQYNTECSYLKTNFFNNIVLYYYTLLYYGNPIFNVNDLPVYFTDPKFGLSFSLDPIVKALAYCPFTYVFSANSIKSPNLIKYAVKIATSNKSCKTIRIRNCGCTTGGKAFLEEFKNTDHDYPIYYDISGNKLNDFPYLFKAFELITALVETLNFEDCNMNEESILSLFDAINENENLWEISELLIAGNYLNENCTGMFVNLMNEFQKSEIFNIMTLSFGPTENIEKLTMMIDCCNQPFQHLRIYGTKITPDSTYDLCRYFNRTETLKNLEFIDCDFEDDSFQQILHTLIKNKNIQHLSLNLSGCKLSGIKFSIFMREVSNGLGSKLYNLSLDRNKLTFDELAMFNNSSEKFPILTSLEFNGNFNACPGMNNQIARLLKLPKLKSLSLNGLGISTLKTDLSQLITDLKTNNTIKHIDISKNMIGDNGYHQFLDLIKNNNNLITAKFSSSEMKNPSEVLEMLEVISNHKSLCNICLFREDVVRLLSGQPPQILHQYSDLLLKAMIKNMQNCALINAVPGEFEFAQTALSSVTAASISSLLQLGGAGIGGGGVSTGCPSIDLQDVFLGGILDDSVYELNKLLQFAKPPVNQHLKMIQNIFGIPYPFNQVNNAEPPVYNVDVDDSRDNKTENQNANNQQSSKNHNSLYVDSSLFGLLVDKSNYDPSEDSLLCKSVIKRRPDIVEELSFYDPTNLLVQPSMKYKIEEDEEDDHHADDNDNDNDNKNRVQIEPPQAHAQAKSSAKRRQTVRPEFKPEPTKMEDVFNEKDENELEDILSEEKPIEQHKEIHTELPEKPVEQQEKQHEKIPTEQPAVQHEEAPVEQTTVQPIDHHEELHAENHKEQQKQTPAEQPEQPVVQNDESHTEQQIEQTIEQHEEPPAENHEEQHEQIPTEQPEQPVVQQQEQPAENHEEQQKQIPAEQPEQPAVQNEESHTEQSEQPVEQHEEVPSEQPAENHEEQQKQIPAEQPEQPAVQNEESHTEQPEQPVEQHEEAPVEQTTVQPIEHHEELHSENHEEQQKQTPAEQLEQPAVQNEESHTEQPEQPVVQNDESHTEQQLEQTIEQHEEPPAENHEEQHEQIPTEQPEQPVVQQQEQPAENHEEQIIADQPTDQSPEQHEEPPAE